MLLELSIENFALIEKISIDFSSGFNVLSGETGSGKSIIIDAIDYVLGGKFNKDFIRFGANKTYVEAVFTIESENTRKLLEDFEIEYDDTVIISRETNIQGKSISKINGRAQILSNIKLISESLLDIHGQHENGKLLKAYNHIIILDDFCGDDINEYLFEYENEFKKLTEMLNKYEDIKQKGKNKEKSIDFIKYQLDEIDMAKLKIGEEEKLQEDYQLLSNSEKINTALSYSYMVLYEGREETNSLYESLGTVIKELRAIEKYLPKIKEIAASIENSYYNLEEAIYEIRDVKENINTNEDELNKVNERMYLISSLKKKYGENISEILNYREKINVEYIELINLSGVLCELEKNIQSIKNNLEEKSKKIHNVRTEKAKILEDKIHKELSYIGMEKSKFKVSIEELPEICINGKDKVSFIISTNAGEPLKPLEKIVSGGELSRIMLSIKTVALGEDAGTSIVFDEIDTGISGSIAQRVGEKMYQISRTHQVFCITHLPQIAAFSDAHYLVFKETLKESTYSKIKKLTVEEKEKEIAKMLSGTEVTEITLKHSKEIINMADNKKNLIF